VAKNNLSLGRILYANKPDCFSVYSLETAQSFGFKARLLPEKIKWLLDAFTLALMPKLVFMHILAN
jgi:hypothetical protein